MTIDIYMYIYVVDVFSISVPSVSGVLLVLSDLPGPSSGCLLLVAVVPDSCLLSSQQAHSTKKFIMVLML